MKAHDETEKAVREVLETEVFPNKQIPNGVPTNIPIKIILRYGFLNTLIRLPSFSR
jgi:hypothetical protein